MLSKEVQDLVDKAHKSADFFKSVDTAMAALRKQNEEMKAKIEEIANRPPVPAPAPPGAPIDPSAPTPAMTFSLSDEDKAALLEVTKSFDDAIDSLKDDIPANTPAETPPAPAPEPIDPAKQQADSDAASQAKPLDGTGAPEVKQDPAG